jgi:hypothetical protein
MTRSEKTKLTQAESEAAIRKAKQRCWPVREGDHARINRLRIPQAARNALHEAFDSQQPVKAANETISRLVRLGVIKPDEEGQLQINWNRISPISTPAKRRAERSVKSAPARTRKGEGWIE